MAINMESILSQAQKLQPSKTGMMKLGTSYLTNPVTRVGVELGVGGAIGVAGGLLDREEDTAGSLLQKGLVAGTIGYAATEGALIGGAKYARSGHASKVAASAIVGRMPGLASSEKALAETIQKGAKSIVPSMNRKMAIGGAGLAAGVLFSMVSNKEEGLGGTAENGFAGAGLALMGAEVLGKFTSDAKPSLLERSAAGILNTESGKNLQKTLQKTLESDTGKQFKGEVSKLFNTDEGKRIQSAFDDIKNGKFSSALFGGNLEADFEKLTRDIERIANTPEGKSLVAKMESEFKNELGRTDAKGAFQRDVTELRKKFDDTFAERIHNTKANLRKGFTDGQFDEIKKLVPEAQKKLLDSVNAIEENYKKLTPGNAPAIATVGNLTRQGIEVGGNKLTHEIEGLKQIDADKPFKPEGEKKEPTPKPEADKVVEKKTVKDVSEADVKSGSNPVLDEKMQKRFDKIKGWDRKLKGAGMVGLGAFALASVMDSGQKLEDQKEVSRMTEKQERNLERKKGQEEKRQREQAYGYSSMGTIAFDLFEERLGHHKMGNAKFQ